MIKSSPYSVSFLLDGFKVDLLPAPNFVSANYANPGKDQHSALLGMISKETNFLDQQEKARMLSPAFSETVVRFVAKQQPFVNAASVLGNYRSALVWLPR